MAFTQFPSVINFKPLDNSTDVNSASEMGSFTLAENTYLGNTRIVLMKHGTAGGTETLKMKLSLSNDVTRAYIESAEINLTDFSTDEYFLGWLTFTFAQETLDSDNTHYAFLEYSNYTRNENTYYLAYAMDGALFVNDFNASDDYGPALPVMGYK